MCRIHYEDLNAAWKETLKYCFRTSDRFSLITRILSKKKGNAVYAHDKALTALEPFLFNRKKSRRKILARHDHKGNGLCDGSVSREKIQKIRDGSS